MSLKENSTDSYCTIEFSFIDIIDVFPLFVRAFIYIPTHTHTHTHTHIYIYIYKYIYIYIKRHTTITSLELYEISHIFYI